MGHYHYPMSMSGIVDHRLIGSLLRSDWRSKGSSMVAASTHGSAELSGSSGASGVLDWGGDSWSWTHCGWLTGLCGMVHEGAHGWIMCDLSGMWLCEVSCGASEVAGVWLGEEKVEGVTGIVTLYPCCSCNTLMGIKARCWWVGDFKSLVLGWCAF